MLFSSTGVGPTITVPLTLPLTRCGAPAGGVTDIMQKTMLRHLKIKFCVFIYVLNVSQCVNGANLTLWKTVASVSIEARPAVTAKACGVVRAECILGALLLESRTTRK